MLTFKQYLLEQGQEAPAGLVQKSLDNILASIQQARGNIARLTKLKDQLEELYDYVPQGSNDPQPTREDDPRARGEDQKSRILKAYRQVSKTITKQSPAVTQQINESSSYEEIYTIVNDYIHRHLT